MAQLEVSTSSSIRLMLKLVQQDLCLHDCKKEQNKDWLVHQHKLLGRKKEMVSLHSSWRTTHFIKKSHVCVLKPPSFYRGGSEVFGVVVKKNKKKNMLSHLPWLSTETGLVETPQV